MRPRSIAIIALVASPLLAIAALSCSEATDGAVPPAAFTPSQDGGPTTDASTSTPEGSVRPDAPLVTNSTVLLNEIAADKEWVELVASGDKAIDVSGFSVADADKDGGGPKVKDAVTFPAGTILAPKSYLVVQGGGLDGGGKDCPEGGQSYCFKAEFGVSNKSGETIYLLDSAGAVVGTAVYPPMGSASGESWGRLPNADPKGIFGITAPTPGSANQPK